VLVKTTSLIFDNLATICVACVFSVGHTWVFLRMNSLALSLKCPLGWSVWIESEVLLFKSCKSTKKRIQRIYKQYPPVINCGLLENPPFSWILFPANSTSIDFGDFPARHSVIGIHKLNNRNPMKSQCYLNPSLTLKNIKNPMKSYFFVIPSLTWKY